MLAGGHGGDGSLRKQDLPIDREPQHDTQCEERVDVNVASEPGQRDEDDPKTYRFVLVSV